ncbi:probable membrane-associated kinase regulator 4 [Phtheirospermum japonicum]|uniref:Probable membrane-associated kinase regulator 4 n=1 Tax=Phtheirospermum japonicum TaxID=374723 RepID=A0A830D452_9LAMI|nr:probable membrane-associated kinase regulator 4 [Phtheirospermum japonicum]
MAYSESKEEEEDYYINMEFEFQSSVSTISLPADHPFHMGKLQNDDESSTFNTPLFTPAATSANNTPFESCNISPSDSCHVSRELNPTDYRSMTSSGNPEEEKKYSDWAKKIKPASNKWTAYLKSLFTKSSAKKQCSNGHFKNSAAKDHHKMPNHRRSFSHGLIFKSLSKPKTASSSSSSTSSSENFKTELENPIQAAIVHCKRSHQQLYSKQIAAI